MTIRMSCTDLRSPTSSNSNSTAARTAVWPPSPAPTCPSSAPGGTTSASTRRRSRPTSAAKSRPTAVPMQDRDWGKFDIQKEVIDLCPTQCMWMEGKKLMIDDKECTRCMHCINVMPRPWDRERHGCDHPVRRQGPDSGRRPDGSSDRSLHEGRSLLMTSIKESHREGLGLVDGRRQEP